MPHVVAVLAYRKRREQPLPLPRGAAAAAAAVLLAGWAGLQAAPRVDLPASRSAALREAGWAGCGPRKLEARGLRRWVPRVDARGVKGLQSLHRRNPAVLREVALPMPPLPRCPPPLDAALHGIVPGPAAHWNNAHWNNAHSERGKR